MRFGLLALLALAPALALAACSDSSPSPPVKTEASAAVVKHDCNDPNWRKENLGLWYSVCRPPMRW